MKPTQLDQVRDALRRETEQLQPVGLEIEDIKRRGGHRRTRSRALVAVATVTCLAGVGVAVSQRPAGKHVVEHRVFVEHAPARIAVPYGRR